MTHETTPIKVTPGSELAQLLEAAARTPVVLEKDGVQYRLKRVDDDPTASTDPAASVAGIQAAAGSWRDNVDVEAFKAYVAERRRTSSRPPVRL